MTQFTQRARSTIALVGSLMHRHQTLWRGAVDAARKYDVNLVCLTSGPIQKNIVQAGFLYGLLDAASLDGLITWGGIGAGLGTHLDPKDMADFWHRYRDLAIVNYEQAVPGIPTVLTDTYLGMRELLAHVIKTHNCRRIALIRGPENHFESQERYRAYVDTLGQFEIPHDPALVCPPAHGWGVDVGRELFTAFLDDHSLRPGLDFDALVGTEAGYVAGAAQILDDRSFRVPQDVVIVAYNDNMSARISKPPLTVMRKSFYRAGYRALEMVLDILAGRRVPDVVNIPSELVLRRSCGCWPSRIRHVIELSSPLAHSYILPIRSCTDQAFEDQVASSRTDILAATSRELESLFSADYVTAWGSRLLDALFVDLIDKSVESPPQRVFLNTLEQALNKARNSFDDFDCWRCIILSLRRHFLHHISRDNQIIAQAEALFHQAQSLVDDRLRRFDLNARMKIEELDYVWDELGFGLLDIADPDDWPHSVMDVLPRLGISSCFLALYENPQSYHYPQPAPTWSRLVFAYDHQSRHVFGPNGPRFLSRQLVPDEFWPQDRFLISVAVPLYIKQLQLGFVLLGAESQDGQVYRGLGERISTVLLHRRLRDEIEERVRTQEALKRARDAAQEANKAKSAFLAHMSHELRTPLNAILGFSQILRHDSALSATHQENLDIINHSGEYLLSLVNDVLEMSKIEAGQVGLQETAANLYHLLDDLERMFCLRALEKDLALVVDIAFDVPQNILIDERKLRQILINLLSNAIKFTEQGRVVLSVCIHSYSQRLSFSVTDTGPGIDSEELGDLFTPFVQTSSGRQSQQGTGLGLAICHRFVQLLGGEIVVQSQLGQGSCFEFAIPFTPIPSLSAPSSRRRVTGLAPEQPHYRLLVVDDQRSNRLLLVRLLEPIGFEVRAVASGQEAVALASSWQPHLIWMDIRMPLMGGYNAARRIKAQCQTQPVIIGVTASSFEQEHKAVRKASFDDLMRKPFRADDVFDLLSKHLGVRFVYQSLSRPAERTLSDLDLSEFSQEWRAEMRHAVIIGDLSEMKRLVEQLQSQFPHRADRLLQLIVNFEHEHILDLLQDQHHSPIKGG